MERKTKDTFRPLKTKISVRLSKTIQETSYEPLSAEINIEIEGDGCSDKKTIRKESEKLRELVVEELEELLIDWKIRGEDDE